MTRNKAAAIVVVAAVLSALAGCSREDRLAGLKVYRHSEDGVPTNVDPIQAATIYSNFVVLAAYDTLYRYKYLARPADLAPNLAADFPDISADGLTYTIRIKPGVEFVDDPAFPGGRGREVVAEDFVYSIKRHFDPANVAAGAWLWQGKIEGLEEWAAAGADYAAPVSGLRALDRHTIQIRLTRPFPQLLLTLAMGFSAVVPPEAVEHYGPELGRKAVGSGPFRLIELTSQRAVFEANPKFRAEPLDLEYEGYDPAEHGHLGIEQLAGRAPPYVDRLEIDFVQETSARWASFTSGREIQYTWMPQEQTEAVLASRNPISLRPEFAERYHWIAAPQSEIVYQLFNMEDPAVGVTGDPERDAMNHALRCAIRDAFDWQERNDRFYSGIAAVFPGVIPPTVPEYDPSADRDSVTRNVERARQRLQAAGWTADALPELEYPSPSDTTQRDMFDLFRGFLVAAGYPPAKIRNRTFANFGDMNRAMRNKEVMMIPLAWGLDYADAENTFQLFYGPYESPGSNLSNYKNPAYDALYEQTAVMQPGPERTALYRRMNQMLIDDCVGIMSLARQRVYLWHKDVIGLPDRDIVGPFWLRWVDVRQPGGD